MFSSVRRLILGLVPSLCVMVGVLVVGAVSAEAGTGYGQVFSFSSPEGFKGPVGLAVDQSDGDVYVVDQGNAALKKFSVSGGVATQLWKAEMPGGNPNQGTVDDYAGAYEGDVFVAGFSDGTIYRFGPEGKMLTSVVEGLQSPTGVAVDGAGDFFVSVYSAGSVLEYNSKWEPVNAEGEPDSHNTVVEGLNGPQTLAVSENGEDIYVAGGSGAVQYTHALLGDVYTRGATLDGSGTNGVTVAGSGDVFVDQGNEVLEYEPSGVLLRKFGGGVLSGAAYGVGVYGSTVYVADNAAGVVHVFEEGAPPPGVAAQFAFNAYQVDVFLDSGVRTGGDNGITTHVSDIPEKTITYNMITIWGVPSELKGNGAGGRPLLTLPTSCGGQPEFSAEELGTWQDEDVNANISVPLHDNEGLPVGFTGCERLRPFVPSISLAPDTSYTDTPAGLSVDVKLQQGLNAEGLATPGLKDTTVTLPEGVVINPGQATGLVACEPSEEALGDEPNGEVNEKAPSCPSASKVGTDELSTPLLPNKLEGNVYILGQNPPNLQLLVSASGEGVNLKLIGNVHLNETTGQLTTTFENTPDLPFTDFKLTFSGGAQAALATPTKCGIYRSTAEFVPWAIPLVESATLFSRFEISAGVGGSPCQWPMSFAPTMTAGATTDQAGGYTDFTMLLQRGDGQQRIEKLQFKTPEGLLGMISDVTLCQEPQAAHGECSAASQIGHTVTTAGPGPYPFEVPQAGGPPAPIYLTGPYDGAPYGLAIVVPVVAGPFNLGTVIVRAKIEVDPHTSQLTIMTGGLPLILDGIPTDLRAIDAVIDRPGFMFNPTNCAPKSFSGTAYSDEGATAALGSHFQMGSCQALKFAPDFKVSTSGKTSRASGASLNVKIIYPTGDLGFNQASSQSNINSVKVDLPKQLPAQLKTLQKACPAATFTANPANCPPASIVGHARALTPVLPVPIEGPAYFVSHGGEAFPNLVLVLQGYGVTIELVGDTFINEKTSITSSTFKNIPDVPISLFELNLPQGKYSALAANGNLCKTKLVMPTAFTGQNGAVLHQSTPFSVTGCPKAKKSKRAKAKKKHAKGKKKK